MNVTCGRSRSLGTKRKRKSCGLKIKHVLCFLQTFFIYFVLEIIIKHHARTKNFSFFPPYTQRFTSVISGKAVPFVELTVAHASVLTILAISFERYYAICEPLRAGYVCTKTRAMVICLLAWGLAALFTRYLTAVVVLEPVCRASKTAFFKFNFFFTLV